MNSKIIRGWSLTMACLLLAAGEMIQAQDACRLTYDSSFNAFICPRPDKEPEFPGGQAAKARFMNRNLRVPDELLENPGFSTHGVVQFVVNSDSTIRHIHVPGKTPDQYFPVEKEIIRLVRLSPKWHPATCGGKPVPAMGSFVIGCILIERVD